MVGGNATIEGFDLASASSIGVAGEEFVNLLFEGGGFGLVDEGDVADFFNGFIAAPPTEDEIDGGEHVALLQLAEDVGQAGAVLFGRSLAGTVCLSTFGFEALIHPFLLLIQQGEEALGVAVVEAEGDWSIVGIDAIGGAVDLVNPIGELVAVGDGGGEGDELDFSGAIDDGFFPNGAPLAIVHVVAFVEDDGFDTDEGGADFPDGGAIEHVAEDFGGHDQDGRIPIDGDIAGEETHVVAAKDFAKVAEFLVGQGFEGGGVKNAAIAGKGAIDGIFAD